MALILLRHGLSAWNEQGLFTGWVDIPLSERGIEQALQAGGRLKALPIDLIYTSTLIRAQMTAFLALSAHPTTKIPYLVPSAPSKTTEVYSEETKKDMIPVVASSALNERCYGRLQGMNKQKMRELYGTEQVETWRRSYDTAPPEGESLADTARRTLPYFDTTILPHVLTGKHVLVAAHGNSLRSIVMELLNLSKDEVVKLEIPTGEPLLYTFKEGLWRQEKL